MLFIGDIVGRPGRAAVTALVPALRSEMRLDLVVANAENIAGGNGITPETVGELLAAGVDVITTGDHVFDQKTGVHALALANVLRPANYPPGTPGSGCYVCGTSAAGSVAVINVMGRVFMKPADCPFRALTALIDEVRAQTSCIVVDMHAEATSEKIAMGWAFDGEVSAIIGTHTHVATADARVLPKGTAYMTDVGMTGAHASVLGRASNAVIAHYRTGMPQKFELARDEVRISAAMIEIDAATGRAVAIEPVVRAYAM
jgi:hypothetical protein